MLKQLISQLSHSLAEKVISINERGLTSVDWTVYNNGTKRTRFSSVPTSDITTKTVTVDGFVLSQKDTAGITTTATRSYTAGGMVFTQTNGRGNTTTTVTDIAGQNSSFAIWVAPNFSKVDWNQKQDAKLHYTKME